MVDGKNGVLGCICRVVIIVMSPKKERALSEVYTLFISERALGEAGGGDGGGNSTET